jgi:hypothetical protein
MTKKILVVLTSARCSRGRPYHHRTESGLGRGGCRSADQSVEGKQLVSTEGHVAMLQTRRPYHAGAKG